MQGKNIKRNLNNKVSKWINSIENEEIQNIIKNNIIITGGAIVSLLQGEEPHDYDVYFRNQDALIQVANYYVDTFISDDKQNNVKPIVQKCYWNDKTNRWIPIPIDSYKDNVETRVRIFIKSAGYVENEGLKDDQDTINNINNNLKETNKTKNKLKDKYLPKYITNNAITLTDGIQIILRFCGEPEEIHKNYDFVHCTSYWTSWDDKLELPARALEAIINKELYYVGSKYPLCSLVRTRKFINRGWNINAGQYVKMAIQLNDLNLKNLHVFEEQLIGVDSFYFQQFISAVRKQKEEDPNFNMDSGYLIELINKVFD